MPHLENVEFYNLQNANPLSSKTNSGGAKVVIICNSNNSRILNSLDTIMRTLKANGHSVTQESRPTNTALLGNDYLCGPLSIDGRHTHR